MSNMFGRLLRSALVALVCVSLAIYPVHVQAGSFVKVEVDDPSTMWDGIEKFLGFSGKFAHGRKFSSLNAFDNPATGGLA